MFAVGLEINLASPKLFGNDNAEEEPGDLFFGYVLEREELDDFSDPDIRFAIAHAYKGEGKSALLRLAREITADGVSGPALQVNCKGSELAPPLDSTDISACTRRWRARIVDRIASVVGKRVNTPVTEAVRDALDGLKSSLDGTGGFYGALVERVRAHASDISSDEGEAAAAAINVIRGWAQFKEHIWVFVDDIDEDFKNTPAWRARVISFFIACRELSIAAPQFVFRLTIRPNVWTIVARESEALSKVSQYIYSLHWRHDQLRRLLAKRIEAYVRRTDQGSHLEGLPDEPWLRDKQIVSWVFDDMLTWRGIRRDAARTLTTFARDRPRWLVELCRVSGRAAAKKGHDRVNMTDVLAQMHTFGRRRVQDLMSEFSSQCSELSELVAAFSGQADEYSLDELQAAIRTRILDVISPRIEGIEGPPSPLEVADFLFQIGFLTARRELSSKGHEYLSYAHSPFLLSGRTGLDQNIVWEVHPIFRECLRLRRREE